MRLRRWSMMATLFLAAVSSTRLLHGDTSTNSPPPPGSLNYVEGNASIGAQTLDSKSVGSIELQRGQALSTAEQSRSPAHSRCFSTLGFQQHGQDAFPHSDGHRSPFREGTRNG